MRTVHFNEHLLEITNDPLTSIISQKINASGRDCKHDSLLVVDISDVVERHAQWNEQLPRVTPFYAVKCNYDSAILSLLNKLNMHFVCELKVEIQSVLDHHCPATRILYSNPCKQASHIEYARQAGVEMMTCDSEEELHKIKSTHPLAKLVIQLLPADPFHSKHSLSTKNGVLAKSASKHGLRTEEVPRVLRVAKDLGLNVVGVKFNVGSNCKDVAAYTASVALARAVFDLGERAGFHFDLLDIGGGFPPSAAEFNEVSAALRLALSTYFPKSMGVRIIAEPGRFYVSSAYTLVVNVIAKKVVPQIVDEDEENGSCRSSRERQIQYYINDGVFGCFNGLYFDGTTTYTPEILQSHTNEPKFKSSLFGPTCDSLDVVFEGIQLPELEVGEWMLFRGMGAYTVASAAQFNGFVRPHNYYIMRERQWNLFGASE